MFIPQVFPIIWLYDELTCVTMRFPFQKTPGPSLPLTAKGEEETTEVSLNALLKPFLVEKKKACELNVLACLPTHVSKQFWDADEDLPLKKSAPFVKYEEQS